MTRRFWVAAALTRPARRCSRWATCCRAGRSRRCSRRAAACCSSSRWPRRSACGRRGRSSCAPSQSVENRSLNMFTLIGLGVGVAFGYSVVAALAPGSFPRRSATHGGEVAGLLRGRRGHRHAVLLGQVLELRARSQTGAAIRKLLGLAPKSARRIDADGSEEDVPLEHVQVGDRLRVRPGEKVPVDGVVLEGQSASTSRWSPASRSRSRSSRRPVIGATVNGTGALVMRAERVGARDAARADRGAWSPRRSAAARRSRSSPTSCPATSCRSSSPIAVVDVRRLGAGRARAAHGLRARQRGRGADHRVPVRARPRDADVDHGGDGQGRDGGRPVPERRGDRGPAQGRHAGRRQDRHAHRGQAEARDRRRRRRHRRSRAAAARRQPRARQRAPARGGDRRGRRGARGRRSPTSTTSQSITGKGVRGPRRRARRRARQPRADGEHRRRRRRARRTRRGAARRGPDRDVRRRRRPSSPGSSASPTRSRTSTPEAIRALRTRGPPHRHAHRRQPHHRRGRRARSSASTRSSPRCCPIRRPTSVEAAPGAKAASSRWPATASTTRRRWRRPHVGIAMGTGTDVAMESAGVTLVKGDLRGIVARAPAVAARRCANIRQNLFFAFVYNAPACRSPRACCIPAFGLLLSPMIAAAAMSFSSVSVIANALRLRRADV